MIPYIKLISYRVIINYSTQNRDRQQHSSPKTYTPKIFFERSGNVDRKYAIGETTMLGRLFLTGVLQPQRMVLRDDGRAWAIEAFVPVCRVVGRVSREDTH